MTKGGVSLEVRAPRVNDRRVDVDGQRQRFTSQILPSYMRRAPKVTEVLPVLYLRGLSTGDFQAALPILLGEEAGGLSPTTITRLTASWETEYHAWRRRDLHDVDYVYVWVDGVHFRVRLEEDRLCTLVMIGVRADGTKDLIAVEDGYRESTDSWATVLRDLKRRGLRAPAVAVGDGALGFWAAVGAVWPETREQRCWVHRLANVLDKLPKRLQPKAKQALHAIMNAPTRAEAEAGIQSFTAEYDAKYPKAVASLRRDQVQLLTLYDFPAEHWRHLRTTNIIESPFRHGATASAGHQGRRVTDEGPDDGVQALGDGGRALAKSERLGTAAARVRGRALRRWRAGETQECYWRGEGSRRLTHAANPHQYRLKSDDVWLARRAKDGVDLRWEAACSFP
jgi:hypothetical protein